MGMKGKKQSLAEFGAVNQHGNGARCSVSLLPEDIRAQIAASKLFHTTIRNWLKKEYNITVGEYSLARHRRGGCTCHGRTAKAPHAR